MISFIRNQTLKYIVSILFKFPAGFASILWITIVRGVGTIVLPRYLSVIIDKIGKYDGSGNPFTLVAGSFIIFTVFRLIMTISFRLWHYFYYYQSVPRLNQLVKTNAIEWIMQKSPVYFYKYSSGYLLNRVNELVSGTEDVIESAFARNIPIVMNVLIPLIYLFTISSTIAICSLCSLVILVAGITWSVIRLRKYGAEYYEKNARIDGTIVDLLYNILAIKFFNTQDFEKKRIFKGYDEVAEAKRQISFSYLVMFIVSNDLFGMILFILSSYLAFQQLAAGTISTADFIFILVQALTIVQEIWTLLFAVPDLIWKYQKASYAFQVVSEDLKIPEKSNAKKLELTKGVIEFKNVIFNYPEKEVLFSHLNLKIESEQKVALVGHSGSGKSTLVGLLLRLYDVQGGSVQIDGSDVRDVTLKSLYENVTIIPQNAMLLDRTIEDNIKYGYSDATDDEIIKAAKSASIHSFIIGLPNKYKTKISELSGGQKQRVSIARGFLKMNRNPGILVVDEGTSQIDSITEQEIQNSLDKLMKNRTAIVIAHRLSTISKMDRILVMQDGNIVEDGSHEELLKKKAKYYELWSAQNNGIIGTQETIK